MTPQTTFVPGSTITRHHAPIITSDRHIRGKYTRLFERLKPGQCIKCSPVDARKIREALSEWIRRTNSPCRASAPAGSYDDKMGRVWMLEKQTTGVTR